MSLQDVRHQYGDHWAVRSHPHRSAARRRQLPLDVLSKTDLAMTVLGSDLTDLAARLAEQTRLATEHRGKA